MEKNFSCVTGVFGWRKEIRELAFVLAKFSQEYRGADNIPVVLYYSRREQIRQI